MTAASASTPRVFRKALRRRLPGRATPFACGGRSAAASTRRCRRRTGCRPSENGCGVARDGSGGCLTGPTASRAGWRRTIVRSPRGEGLPERSKTGRAEGGIGEQGDPALRWISGLPVSLSRAASVDGFERAHGGSAAEVRSLDRTTLSFDGIVPDVQALRRLRRMSSRARVSGAEPTAGMAARPAATIVAGCARLSLARALAVEWRRPWFPRRGRRPCRRGSRSRRRDRCRRASPLRRCRPSAFASA